jgi:dolichol-phosphate mannosyltransferase
MRIVVVIPTYNEAGAIETVLEELKGVFSRAPQHEWYAVVVDGNSTDGTQEIVSKISRTYPSIHLVVEPEKRGLATAYLTGFAYATKTLHADAYVEFDGDGQHDPSYLLPMAEALESGADYVIGSRYVAGGSVPAQWCLYNRLLSRLGSLYSRLLLELPVHDVTSGFKMTRVAPFAEKLPSRPDQLLTKDYAYKIQFLSEMHKLGAKITEVPIAFRHREQGTSKSTRRDIVESLKVTAIIRLKNLRHWRLPRVLLIGGSGVILQGIIFELLGIQWKLVSPSTATLVGAEFVILSNFFLNERFSFKDKVAASGSLLRRLVRFHLISSGSVIFQWLFIFITSLFTSNEAILRVSFIAALGLGFIVNYIGYYFWVWRSEK